MKAWRMLYKLCPDRPAKRRYLAATGSRFLDWLTDRAN